MTTAKRDKLNNRFRKASKAAKFIKKHINKALGRWIQDRIDSAWFDSISR